MSDKMTWEDVVELLAAHIRYLGAASGSPLWSCEESCPAYSSCLSNTSRSIGCKEMIVAWAKEQVGE